jgi:hypothetical protein
LAETGLARSTSTVASQALAGRSLDTEFGVLNTGRDRHLAPGITQGVFGVLVVLAE